MSVALQIRGPDGSSPRLVPVATEAVYANEWLPVATFLGAIWLPRFQLGADVSAEDLIAVATEFSKAAERFSFAGQAQFATRATTVAATLREAHASDHRSLSFYIG